MEIKKTVDFLYNRMYYGVYSMAESTLEALRRYSERQYKKSTHKRSKKNAKPEKEVEKMVTAWLEANEFDYSIVEAKAAYSPSAGMYLNSPTEPGFSDICADTPWGHSCYIELKALGKRSTLSINQRLFLERKIKKGCFAVVTDSVKHLETNYIKWKQLYRNNGPKAAKEFLMSLLPKKKEYKNEKIFNE